MHAICYIRLLKWPWIIETIYVHPGMPGYNNPTHLRIDFGSSDLYVSYIVYVLANERSNFISCNKTPGMPVQLA